MKKKKRNYKSKHNNSYGRRQKKTRRSRKPKLAYNDNLTNDIYICPICNRKIYNITTTILERETKKLAHFDCIIKQIKKSEKLRRYEAICYVGGGNFAVVSYRNSIGKNDFTIVKKIKYEEKNK